MPEDETESTDVSFPDDPVPTDTPPTPATLDTVMPPVQNEAEAETESAVAESSPPSSSVESPPVAPPPGEVRERRYPLRDRHPRIPFQ